MMRKGQYITLEQVIVFSMGIFILISITMAYNSAKVTTKDISSSDQFVEMGEFVLSNIVYTYNSGRNRNLTTEVFINIPRELGSQGYEIIIDNQEILVISLEDTKLNASIQVGNINETVTLEGNATSAKGRAKINYNISSNTISLRDV